MVLPGFSLHDSVISKILNQSSWLYHGAYNQLKKMWHLSVNSLTSIVPRRYLLGQSSWGASAWSRRILNPARDVVRLQPCLYGIDQYYTSITASSQCVINHHDYSGTVVEPRSLQPMAVGSLIQPTWRPVMPKLARLHCMVQWGINEAHSAPEISRAGPLPR